MGAGCLMKSTGSGLQRIKPTSKYNCLCHWMPCKDGVWYICDTNLRWFLFWTWLVCIVRSHVVISSYTDLPLQPCEERYAADTTLYFSLFSSAYIAFQLLHIFSRCAALSITSRFIYIISLFLCHFVCLLLWYFKLHPCLKLFLLKRCVKPYSHTQQVVVLLDSSPTGILPAPVVIVTDVQPQDIPFPSVHSSSKC